MLSDSQILNFYSGKRILITGANAYLGPRLAAGLAILDCRLVLHGHSEVKHGFSNHAAVIERHSGNLAESSAWEKLAEGADIIFHFAAHEKREFEPELDYAVNAATVLNLLQTCREKGYRPKIVFASSSNLVGLTERLPVDESFADRPLTIYAIHKQTAENYLRYFAESYGIPSITLRLANLYGPSVDSQATLRVAANRMVKAAAKEGHLTVFKNRHCVRDYLYIDDAIAAFLAAGADQKSKAGSYCVVGSGKGYNFEEFARVIGKVIEKRTGRKITLTPDDVTELVPAEFRNFVADSSRFRKLTGWKAEVSLEVGIERTLEYLYKNSK